jgi:hypothetical protein
MEDRKVKQVLFQRLVAVEGGGYKERMYENGKMRPAETILRMRGDG